MTEDEAKLDPSTGRPFGDHGTAQDAIDFLLDTGTADGMEAEFLEGWRHGSLEEWPEFYEWLAVRPAAFETLDTVRALITLHGDDFFRCTACGHQHDRIFHETDLGMFIVEALAGTPS